MAEAPNRMAQITATRIQDPLFQPAVLTVGQPLTAHRPVTVSSASSIILVNLVCRSSGLSSSFLPMTSLMDRMPSAALCRHSAALGILSISDVIGKNEELSPEDRQTKFTNMMELALDTVTSL